MAEGLLTRWTVLGLRLALLAIAVGIGGLTRKRRGLQVLEIRSNRSGRGRAVYTELKMICSPRVRFALLSWCVVCGQLTVAAVQEPVTPHQIYRPERAPRDVRDLTARFTPHQIGVLEALNRIDAARLPSLKELIVPEVWHADLLSYSPFPSRIDPSEIGSGKLLIVHQPGQAFAAYDAGRLIRWGPISSGRALSPTPQGLFHLNWRSPGRHSTVNARWFMPWYFNFHNEAGLAFHQFALPGRPASHSCVRLLERDARWLYDWGEGWTLDDRGWEVLTQGTPVLIVGCYGFGGEMPWRSTDWLATGIELPVISHQPEQPCVAPGQ